jgi:hypothetical protein
MSEAALLRLYRQWEKLTHAETEAIDGSAWARVGQIQAEKLQLQPAILAATADLRKVGAATTRGLPAEIGHVLAGLIQLEQSNGMKMSFRLAEARAERSRLGRSASQLRELRRAYVRSEGRESRTLR